MTLLLTGEASVTPSLALLPHHSFISSFTSLLHHSFISSITSLSALGEGWPRRRVGHSPERLRADCKQDIVICGSTSPTDDDVMTSLYVSLRRSRWTDPRADTAPTGRTQTACASSCMETGWRAVSVCACACTRAGDACTRGLAHEGGRGHATEHARMNRRMHLIAAGKMLRCGIQNPTASVEPCSQPESQAIH